MLKTTFKKMIIEETKDLSEDKLNEILDFILFIKEKKEKKSFVKNISNELTDLHKTSLVHLEEEFKNYKDLYPHD